MSFHLLVTSPDIYLYLNKVIHEFTFYTLHEYCSGTFRTVSRLFREVVHLLLMILVLLDTLLFIYTTIQLYNKGRVLVGLVSELGGNKCCNKHCYTYQDSLIVFRFVILHRLLPNLRINIYLLLFPLHRKGKASCYFTVLFTILHFYIIWQGFLS